MYAMIKNIYHNLAHKFRNITFIKQHPAIKEILKYSVVGNLTNIVDVGLYIYLTRAFIFWEHHYLIANLITMFIASVIRFVFHKKWTFRDKGQDRVHKQFIKFSLLMVLGLAITEVILYVCVEYFYIYDLIGKIIAMAAVTVIVYYLTRTWIFNKSHFTFRNWR